MIAITPVLHAVLVAVVSLGCYWGCTHYCANAPYHVSETAAPHPPPPPYKMMSIMAYTVDLNVQLLKTIDRHRFHTRCAYLFLYLDLDFTHPYLKILDSALCITCDKEYLLSTWITTTLLRVLLLVGTI